MSKLNPQTSDPTLLTPNKLKFIIPEIDIFKSLHVAELSPNQWDAYLPDPTNILLVNINGLYFILLK